MSEVTNEQIVEALGKLDTDNDAHWTEQGLPVVKAVSELAGEQVTREQITQAAPRFNRTAPLTDPESEDKQADGAETTDNAQADGAETREPETKEELSDAIEANEAKIQELRAHVAETNREIEALEKETADLMDQKQEKFPPISYIEALKATSRDDRLSGRSRIDQILSIPKHERNPALATHRPVPEAR